MSGRVESLLTDEFHFNLRNNYWKDKSFIVNNKFDYNLLKKHNLSVDYDKMKVNENTYLYNSVFDHDKTVGTFPFAYKSARFIEPINELIVIKDSKAKPIQHSLSKTTDMTPLPISGTLTINEDMSHIEMASILFYLLSYYDVTITEELYDLLQYYIKPMKFYRLPFISKEKESYRDETVNLFNFDVLL